MARPPNVPTTLFGKRVQDHRLALGLSQADLGALAGIQSPGTAAARISRYESGTHFPDPETLALIAKALKVPVAYLCADNAALAELALLAWSLPKRRQGEAVEVLRAFLAQK